MRVAKLGALVLLGVGLAGVMGPGCSNRAEDPALNGEGVRGSVPTTPSNEMTGGSGGMTGGGGGGTLVGSGGMTGEGAGGMGGGTSVSGSGGTTVPCPTNPGCAPQDAICGAGVCIKEQCVFTPKPIASDVYGDCHKTTCDDQGKILLVEDDSAPNAYDDGKSCTKDECMSGKPTNTIDPKATCDFKIGVKGICDPDGLCVECLSGPDCKNVQRQCVSGKCVPLFQVHCFNNVQDKNETDIDCGGSDCAACADSKKCTQGSDCQNLFCYNGAGGDNHCYAPNCLDGVKNGAETSTDCGGKDCRPKGRLCSDQGDCALPTDCKSGVCKAGFCQAPSCTDGVKNGSETDIDCGGGCNPALCFKHP